MKNPYLQFSYQMLLSFKKIYEEDIKDSTLPPKKQANAKAKLKLVEEAIKQK